MPNRDNDFRSEKKLPDPKATIWQHINELRRVLLISVIAVLVGFVVVFIFFSENLVVFFSRPLLEHGVDIIHIGLAEPFMVQMRIAFVVGFVLASPIVVWQIWSFLRPALLPKERVTFRSVFLISTLLFIAGVLFAYAYVFGITVSFFLLIGENLATPLISLDLYLRMLLTFVIPFGLAFQFPVIVYFLHRLGIVKIDGLRKKRKYVVFAICVIATLITPPDLLSKIMLVIPMCLLYEASIIFLRITTSSKKA